MIVSLSNREREILKMAACGSTDKEICGRLAISMPTVRTHWGRMRKKLGVVNRSHAIAVALEEELSKPSSEDSVTSPRHDDAVHYWIWHPSQKRALLDRGMRRIFGLPEECDAITLDQLLDRVWTPDQRRLESFLLQSANIRPMTPFECRAGAPGNFKNVVRSVNLTTRASTANGVTVLMASALERSLAD